MTITGGSALAKDDIERMMREAEQYADDDRQRKEAAETRNNAEGLVYQTEKFLADNADKLPEDARSNVDGPLADLKKALQGEDVDAIRVSTDTLATASQALGAAMYANVAAGEDPTGFAEGDSAGSGSADDEADIVDADVVEDVVEDEVVDAEVVDEGSTESDKQ